MAPKVPKTFASPTCGRSPICDWAPHTERHNVRKVNPTFNMSPAFWILSLRNAQYMRRFGLVFRRPWAPKGAPLRPSVSQMGEAPDVQKMGFVQTKQYVSSGSGRSPISDGLKETNPLVQALHLAHWLKYKYGVNHTLHRKNVFYIKTKIYNVNGALRARLAQRLALRGNPPFLHT